MFLTYSKLRNTKAWMMSMGIVLGCLLLVLNIFCLKLNIYKIHHINLVPFDIFEQVNNIKCLYNYF